MNKALISIALVGGVLLALLGGSLALASRTGGISSSGAVLFYFDFESGLQGWHIRQVNGEYYGTAGSDRVVSAACPLCPGSQAFEFQVDLRTSRENRGQIEYVLSAGTIIPTDTLFSAWVWVPSSAPEGLEAEFFVQSGSDWSHWSASRPRVVLTPGQWVRLVGKSDWAGGAWTAPQRTIGIEVKAVDGYPIPVGDLAIRVDDVRLSAPEQEVFLPVVSRNAVPPIPPRVVWDYRGASIAGYWQHAYAPQGNAYEMIDQLQAVGVNAITVLATWYQDGFTTSQIERGSMTPRDEDVIALIQYAHQRGMRVVLKPHVDPLDGWRGDIAPANSSEWFEHFTNDFLLHYARMAQEQQVEMLVIGTEYDKLFRPSYVNHWADVIAAVRQAYQGKVTYAATEPSLFSGEIPDWFWQSLDMVGVTFYHPFSHARTPGVTEVVQAWQTHHIVADLQAFHQRFGVPVLLAEVGYRSIDYAGIEAWRTEGPNGGTNVNPEQSIAYNGEGQANLYEGLFRALGNQPWVAGIFMWQYVPDGGCKTALRGGIGNTDYSVLGKPAALTIHNWFGGPTTAPAQWQADADNPLVDRFEYWAPEYVEYGWQVATSGAVSLTVDLEHHPSLASSARSLLVETQVPVEAGRFQQMDRYFCDGARDWRGYKSIELWVRTDMLPGEPQGCELSIGLIDGRSQAREFWQSSQWLERAPAGIDNDGWRKVQIALTGAITTENDPWRHPTDFVIPEWEKPVNGVLDLSAVLGVRIKTLATEEHPAYPNCRVWLGPMQVSTQAVEIIPPPDPPLIDAFEYQRATAVARVWKAPGTLPGTVIWTPDTQRRAPTGSTRSWHIHTHTPCASPRFEEVTNFVLGGGVDLSGYAALELWAGGDLLNEPPYGGEFSIVLEDRDGEQWQSTRWLGRTIQGAEYLSYGLEPVRISLTSFVTATGASPWSHPADFVLINEVVGGNQHLDLDEIQSITLKTLTTDEYCAQYPDYDVWIDRLVASTVPVVPPELVHPPTLDRFDYGDKETARIIWKWVASGQINVTMDNDVHAPGSSRSMRISSTIPAGGERYGQVFNSFIPGAQDLSAYSSLRFWARTDNVAPWGGELSIELVETDPIGHAQEVWRNTRWFGNSNGEWITINLAAGAGVQADPWDPAYQNSFVVPTGGQFVDGVLDLTRITEIRIIPLTTQEAASRGYTHLDLWIDEMTVR